MANRSVLFVITVLLSSIFVPLLSGFEDVTQVDVPGHPAHESPTDESVGFILGARGPYRSATSFGSELPQDKAGIPFSPATKRWRSPKGIPADGTQAGEGSRDPNGNIILTFPEGGGSFHNVSLEVPQNCHVENASLSLTGLPVASEQRWVDDSAVEFAGGTCRNVSVSNTLQLDERQDEAATEGAWRGTALHNTTVAGGIVSLELTAVSDFFTERRGDSNGAYEGDSTHMLDMVSGSNGTLHLVYLTNRNEIYYRRSFDRGLDWSPRVVLYNNNPPHGSIGPLSLFISPGDELHFFSKLVMDGGSSLIHKVSRDNGTTWNEGTLINSGVAARDIKLCWDGEGVIHGLGAISYPYPPFDSFLRYFNSTDGGLSWSSTWNINDSADASPPSFEYDIAVDSTGRVHVVWADHRDFGWNAPRIYYTNFTQGVNHPPNRALDIQNGISMEDPRVDIGPNDRVHVAWSDNRSGTMDIIYANSSNGGLSFTAPRIVNDVRNGEQSQPEMDISDVGKLHLVWQDSRSGESDIYYSNSTDHREFITPVRINSDTTDEQRFPALSLSPSGLPSLAWNDGRAGAHRIYATSQVAPYCDSGIVGGTFDLGLAPADCGAFSGEYEAPQGTFMNISLRTSPDNATWSDWEIIDFPGGSDTSPPERYVQWMLRLGTGDNMVSPRVRRLTMGYSYHETNGVYTSSSRPVKSGEADYTLEWTGSPNGGDVECSLSPDNGSTWMPCGSSMNLSGDSIAYRLVLSGSTASSPVVSSVMLNRTGWFIPRDITVDVGFDGTIDRSYSGEFGRKEYVIFESELQRFIDGETPGPGNLSFEFEISSGSAGQIEIGDVVLDIDHRPEIISVLPEGGEATVEENGTLRLKVNASDPDDAELHYEWYLDGSIVAGGRSFDYSPGFEDEGVHVVTVNVSDVHSSVNYTWIVRVVPTNRPPDIQAKLPPGNVTIELGGTLGFELAARDPDNDSLAYSWQLDGRPVGTTRSSFILNTSLLTGVGNYTLSVLVSDGELSSSAFWIVEVYEYAADLSVSPQSLSMEAGAEKKVDIILTNTGSRRTLFTLVYEPRELGGNELVVTDAVSLLPGGIYSASINISIPEDTGPNLYSPGFVAKMSDGGRKLTEAVLTVKVPEGQKNGGGGEGGDEKGSVGIVVIWVLAVIFAGILIACALAFLLIRRKKKADTGEPVRNIEKTGELDGGSIQEGEIVVTGAAGPPAANVIDGIVPGQALGPEVEVNTGGGALRPGNLETLALSPPGMPQQVPVEETSVAEGLAFTQGEESMTTAPVCPSCPGCGAGSVHYPEYDCFWCAACQEYVYTDTGDADASDV